MSRLKINIPQDKIAEFCRRNHILKLSVFGSALREDFDTESDVDVLVELNPGARIGMIRLAAMELEMSRLIGRKVDLNTPGFINPTFQKQIISDSEVQYEAA
jgi:predicted nucleotidyltransferase